MNRQTSGALRAGLVILLLASTALLLHWRGNAEVFPPREPLSAFPSQLGSWHGTVVPIPRWALDVLGAGEFAERVYSRASNKPSVDLLVAYYPSERMGSAPHSPQNCLPGSGWVPAGDARIRLALSSGRSVQVNRYILSKGLDRVLVYYWYQSHGRTIASDYWAKFYLVEDSIRLNRSDGALVRITTPIAENDTEVSAEQRARALINEVFPLLDHYIPR